MIGFWCDRSSESAWTSLPLHVAGDDEEDQVGRPGHLAGQGFADLAAHLVDARRVDQDQPRLIEPRGPPGSLLPALGRTGNGGAVRGADLENVAAQQGIEDRRLAAADHAEGGNLDGRLVELLGQIAKLADLVGENFLFLGRELQARRGWPLGCRGRVATASPSAAGFAFFSVRRSSFIEHGLEGLDGILVNEGIVGRRFRRRGHEMVTSAPSIRGTDHGFTPLCGSQEMQVESSVSRLTGQQVASRPPRGRSEMRPWEGRAGSRAS